MKVAVIGSRSLDPSRLLWLAAQLPLDCTAIVSGGAKGVDQLAFQIAQQQGLPCVELLPAPTSPPFLIRC